MLQDRVGEDDVERRMGFGITDHSDQNIVITDKFKKSDWPYLEASVLVSTLICHSPNVIFLLKK